MRLIDADAFVKEETKLYCEKCERRMGMKNGKKKFVYDIGDAPCRACGVGDLLDDIDNAPTVEPPIQVTMKDLTVEEKQHFFNVWKDAKLQIIEEN